MSSFYTKGQADDEESIRVLRRAAELGCTMIDTSSASPLPPHCRCLKLQKLLVPRISMCLLHAIAHVAPQTCMALAQTSVS